MKKFIVIVLLSLCVSEGRSSGLLIPMDEAQTGHLKAYGIVFSLLQQQMVVDWLLNYRGGSFLADPSEQLILECRLRGVSFEVLSADAVHALLLEIESPSANMNSVRLEKAPRVVVYSPKSELVADESDAVIAVLDFSQIPYRLIYDQQILNDSLVHYDWLHLHHEDFTGQNGRFNRRESEVLQSKFQEVTARQFGYSKVSAMKLDVARRIKNFCLGGGYLFAMCSAAETLDIALAADGVDISDSEYDGDDMDPGAQQKLDFTRTLAFENFTLDPGHSRRFSDINTATGGRGEFSDARNSFFRLFQFSAKWDVVATMLTQDHERTIHEFYGQTSAFNKYVIKPQAMILGENSAQNRVRYLYNDFGKGHWTFYSGHDPEGTPGKGRTVNLTLFPKSPGYRLILNNVLFPSAKKKKQKT